MTKKLTIFIDIDSVVFNINKKVIDIANKEFKTNYNYKDNTSWWWKDYTLSTGYGNKLYFEEILNKEGFFRSGDIINYSNEVIDKFHNLGYKVYFLSAPHWSSKTFSYDRVRFLEDLFDWFVPEEHLILTNKKGLLASKNRILVDDNINNLKSWKKNGGTAIAFGEYGWNKEWQGLRAKNWRELFILIRTLEEMKGVNKVHE